MIERTYRGVAPQPTITAPLSCVIEHMRDNHDPELTRLAFAQSAASTGGHVAAFRTTPYRTQPMPHRAEPYAPVIVCAIVVALAAIFAVGFGLSRQWRAALAAVIVGLAAVGFGRQEYVEIKRARQRQRQREAMSNAALAKRYPEQPRRGIR